MTPFGARPLRASGYRRVGRCEVTCSSWGHDVDRFLEDQSHEKGLAKLVRFIFLKITSFGNSESDALKQETDLRASQRQEQLVFVCRVAAPRWSETLANRYKQVLSSEYLFIIGAARGLNSLQRSVVQRDAINLPINKLDRHPSVECQPRGRCGAPPAPCRTTYPARWRAWGRRGRQPALR